MSALLTAQNLQRRFRRPGGGVVNAVRDVSFSIGRGETLGLVGESGSGKSTTGRLVLQLDRLDAGEVTFDGRRLTGMNSRALRSVRRHLQAVFQDPYAALDPRMTVGAFVEEPFLIHREARNHSERADRVAELFRRVGLDPAFMQRYPHEFSGGQRQRVCIARAIALGPSLIVADEPITALDVSIQAQIINLFQDLQAELGLAYLFIAHDLNMVRYLCRRVAVMRAGRIVEIGPVEIVFAAPAHPYTRALLSAIPVPDPTIARRASHLLPPPPDPMEGVTLTEIRPDHFVLR